MREYLNLLKDVLENGQQRDDRTKTGTISKFGTQVRYDLRNGFPLLTTKKVYFKAIAYEMLWFIHGDTNIKYLVDHNVNIWNEWPFEIYKKSADYQNETLEQFVEKIRTDDQFAKTYGELGPVYGKQWRNFNGVDQLANVIDQIKNNPFSRRIILSAWNPAEVEQMALPPCHTLCQFYVSNDGYLDLQLYQRSGDLFLGVPFNIASYALLLTLVAQECNLTPRYFIHTLGDSHIYSNHVEQVKLQLKREPLPLPEIEIDFNGKSIFEIDYEDIHLKNYQSYAPIKARVAV